MVLCFACVMSVLLFQENKHALERNIKELSTDFIAQQRHLLKSNIDGLSSQIAFEKEYATDRLQHELKEQVHEAHKIAEGIYHHNVNLTNEEIGEHIKDALRNVRFNNGRGYFFAISLDGFSQLSPIYPKMEGQSLAKAKDFRGINVVQEMMALMKNRDESIHQWWFRKPNDKSKKLFLKFGFIKRFEPLNWYLGTGEYKIDFEKELQFDLLNKLMLNRDNNETSYFIVDSSKNYIAHDDQAMLSQEVNLPSFDFDDIESFTSNGKFINSSSQLIDKNGLLKDDITYAKYNPAWQWTIVGKINTDQLNLYYSKRKDIIEKENEETLFKIMVTNSLLTLILTSFSFLLSHYTAQRFERYQRRIMINIKKLERNKSQLNFLAYNDPLTRLPNRRHLEETINKEIITCDATNTKMAIIFFDLDDFKKINDHYGHSTGDQLLIILGKYFQGLLGENDSVFRFGGDEFIFCFSQFINESEVVKKIEAIQQVFNEHIKVNSNALHVKGTMGIACFPQDARSASELIRKADLVLYKTKRQKKGDYLFFDQSLDHQLERALVIETQLRTALKNREFTMVYQPQMCAKSGDIMGAEALIRWENKVLGNVRPDEFISIAENIGLITKMGEFIIEQSCHDIALYNDDNDAPISLSINVSPEQLISHNFVEHICSVTHKYGISNAYITVEITENVLVEDIANARVVIQSLRDLGFDVSLDDFGTGYSSLSYLSQLPISEIKIDRSFILEFLESDQSLSLVKSIISIGKSCHMSVVAEGVEDIAQYEKLKSLGCDIIQGYYFSKPLKIEKLITTYTSS